MKVIPLSIGRFQNCIMEIRKGFKTMPFIERYIYVRIYQNVNRVLFHLVHLDDENEAYSSYDIIV